VDNVAVVALNPPQFSYIVGLILAAIFAISFKVHL